MPVIVRGAVPELVSVTGCDALVVPTSCEPKVKLVGDSVTAAADPVPGNGRDCGLFDASSEIETLAVRLPAVAGENVTEIVHVALIARVDGASGQSLVSA